MTFQTVMVSSVIVNHYLCLLSHARKVWSSNGVVEEVHVVMYTNKDISQKLVEHTYAVGRLNFIGKAH